MSHSPGAAIGTPEHPHEHEAAPRGWQRWMFATNHKDIGTLYLWFSLTMFLSGGVLALLIRAELFQPGTQLMSPEFYNQLVTLHGLIMVFGAIMPAFGIISHVVPTFARKPLFGYASMVYALAAIAVLSFIVWAHHMFATGMPITSQLFFMYATMLVAVPTGVKVFNWIATMWQGALSFETAMLFAIGFIFVFTIGGFSGLILAVAAVDIQVHDTHYVIAHFHYVLVAGSLFALFAGYYYWAPKWTGHCIPELRGRFHFWNSLVWLNVTFFPMHFLGLAGMPRRYIDYPTQFADFNALVSVGAFLFAVVLPNIRGGKQASAKPWEGAEGLEWSVPSPAPFHTFEQPPIVK